MPDTPPAAATQPPDAETSFMEGTGHLAECRYDAAERCFREALRLVPDLPEAAVNLGYMLDNRGETAEAEH